MFSKKKRRPDNDVNAGSMADIAFLLLIFFLVTTTIVMDEGIIVRLPPWEEDQRVEDRSARNVLSVKVNKKNELLVEGEKAEITDLRTLTKDFILNPLNKDDLAKTPQDAIVSLQNDRSTSYETYLAVYNELKGAYSELRNDASQKTFGKNFDVLASENKKTIIAEIPMIISEAEPTDYVVE